MATHDYDIANQSGANFRTDLNNCLDAIVSNNSNASDPSTTFAYMWWVDTSNNVLKLRNSANNAWITLPMSITASNTITPTLNMGTGAEEDVKIVFDGNAQDFYIGLDDSADDLLIGKGSTVGTTPAIAIDENLLTTLHGGLTMVGTTPTLTIGDGGAEDTKIVFDGNAQDYYIGLDDSADDLIIGKGSAVGTTPAIAINENEDVCINGSSFALAGGASSYGNLTINGASGGILEFANDGVLQTLIQSVDTSFQLLHQPNVPALFGVNNAECFRIIAGNTLGVGTTTSDSHKMAIDSGSGTSLGLMHKSSNAFTLMTFKASGTSQDIRLGATGNDMVFQTNGTERMRVRSGGGLLINSTSSITTSSQLELHGNPVYQYFRNTTATSGLQFRIEVDLNNTFYILNQSSAGVYIASGNTAWTGLSDETLKENITDIGSVLDKVKNYRTAKYNWKNDSDKKSRIGFIAQDWEKDFPQVIEKDKDEKLGINYTETIPVLLKAIQEQQEQIESLQQEIEVLKNGN